VAATWLPRAFASWDSFKTKTKTIKLFLDQEQVQCSCPRPRLCISRSRTAVDVQWRPTKKHFSLSGVKNDSDDNEIPFTNDSETTAKIDIHFRPTDDNESPVNVRILCFSYIHTPSQPYNAQPKRRPVSPFLLIVLLTGFKVPNVQCTDMFVAFFYMTFVHVNSLLLWIIAGE